MRFWLNPALLALLVLGAACAPKVRIGEDIPSANLDWRRMAPSGVLERLKEGREKLPGLSAMFVLTMDQPPPGQFSYLNGLIFIGKSPEGQPALRIKALGPMGNVYFDMVMQGESLQIYVPMRETLYQGQASDMEKGGMGNLFAWMMFDPATAQAARGAPLEVGQSEAMLTLTIGRLALDKRTGLPLELRGPEQTVRFEKYQALPDGYPPVPARIVVTDGSGKGKAKCELRDIKPGLPPASAFDLSGYAPKRVEPLNALSGKRR